MPGNYGKFNQYEFNQGPVYGEGELLIAGSSTVMGDLIFIFVKLVSGSIEGSSTVSGRLSINHQVSGDINGFSRVKLNLYGRLGNFGLTLNGETIQLSNVMRSFKIGYKIIGISGRNAHGKMNRRDITRKRTFEIAWQWLPYETIDVIDGGAGAKVLRQIWEESTLVVLTVPDGPNGEFQDYICMFEQEGFKRNIKHINDREFWDVSMSFLEV